MFEITSLTVLGILLSLFAVGCSLLTFYFLIMMGKSGLRSSWFEISAAAVLFFIGGIGLYTFLSSINQLIN